MDRNKTHNVNYKNKLKRLIVEKDGLITTKEVEELGIPRLCLTRFTRDEKTCILYIM